MSVSDPIADMLTRIRNANVARHDTVRIPGSKQHLEIARILAEEGYIHDYDWLDDGPQGSIRIRLKYGPERERVISEIKRVSKPGLRVYVKVDEIPTVLGGLGIAVLSTSRGVMTDSQARAQGVGGEVYCYVW